MVCTLNQYVVLNQFKRGFKRGTPTHFPDSIIETGNRDQFLYYNHLHHSMLCCIPKYIDYMFELLVYLLRVGSSGEIFGLCFFFRF